ncbi:MAG TPA: EamA family transporter, partial [Rhodospirillales bacterium]|nr:EamA family transporter [Rhodospirillales bacterium]
LLGLGGTVVLVLGNNDGGRLSGFKSDYWLGYLMALAGALTWTAYSVLSRKLAHMSSDTVGAFCGGTAILATLAHLAFETTVWPSGGQWLAVLGLGLGPVGVAFFTWDYGVKHGNIQALGALSYAAPLLSTLILIAVGKGEATISVALACVMIVGGAVLASKDMLGFSRSR